MNSPARDILDTMLGYLGFVCDIDEEERESFLLLQVHTPVDAVVNEVDGHAVWIAAVLFVVSLSCWMVENKGERAILGDKCEPV